MPALLYEFGLKEVGNQKMHHAFVKYESLEIKLTADYKVVSNYKYDQKYFTKK